MLSALVLDTKLMKDLDQMADFKHTGKFSDKVILYRAVILQPFHVKDPQIDPWGSSDSTFYNLWYRL